MTTMRSVITMKEIIPSKAVTTEVEEIKETKEIEVIEETKPGTRDQRMDTQIMDQMVHHQHL